MKRVKQTVKWAALAALVVANAWMAGRTFKTVQKMTTPYYVEALDKELIVIEGPILDLSSHADVLRYLVKKGTPEVTIYINSPGGLVSEASGFIAFMEAAKMQEVTLTCVVDGMAASAAASIFSHCDNRYAVFGSVFMFHSAFTGAPEGMKLSETTAGLILEHFTAMNSRMWAETRKHFWPWYFNDKFTNESLTLASELESEGLDYVRVIRNLDIIFSAETKESK